VNHPAAVLVLIAVLAAGPATGIPFDLEVIWASKMASYFLSQREHGNGDSRRMDPAASLGGGNTLDTMAACFVLEIREIFSRNLYTVWPGRLPLSSESIAHAAVSHEQIATK